VRGPALGVLGHSAATCCQDHHRGQERGRRVEVQEGRRDGDECERGTQRGGGPTAEASEMITNGVEEPFAMSERSDEEQPGHKNERLPRVRHRRSRVLASQCDCRRAKNSAGDNGDDSDAHSDILAPVTTAVSKNRVIAPDRRVLHPMVRASACHQEQREPTKRYDKGVLGPRTLSADRAVR
jgi:hypothetical protein